MKEKIHFVHECLTLGDYFFEEPQWTDTEFLQKKKFDENREVYEHLICELEKIINWGPDEIQQVIKNFNWNGKKVDMQTFRYLISGQTGGPVLFEVASVLGKDVVLQRLKKCLNL